MFRPKDGRAWNDNGVYLTAVGLLPHHSVLPPWTASADLRGDQLVEYVIAVDHPFDHPSYAADRRFPSRLALQTTLIHTAVWIAASLLFVLFGDRTARGRPCRAIGDSVRDRNRDRRNGDVHRIAGRDSVDAGGPGRSDDR